MLAPCRGGKAMVIWSEAKHPALRLAIGPFTSLPLCGRFANSMAIFA
jgi:hypothetical protein